MGVNPDRRSGVEVLNSIVNLSVMEELDKEPMQEELSKAIDSLASGKAPGIDGITPDIIKLGKPSLAVRMTELSPKICVIPRLSLCTSTTETAVTAITTAVSPCSTSWGRCRPC